MGRAFSLMELVVVMAIIGITALIAAPKYAASVTRFRADSAASRVKGDLELMRARARAASAPRTFTFDTTTDTYTVSAERGLDDSSTFEVDLSRPPYDCDLVIANFGGTSSLTLDGFGSAPQTGRIVVRAGSVYRTIFVGTSDETIEAGNQASVTAPMELGGGATDILR